MPGSWTSEKTSMRVDGSSARTTRAQRLLPKIARLMRKRDFVVAVRLQRADLAFVRFEAARYGVSVEDMVRALSKEELHKLEARVSQDAGVRIPIAAVWDMKTFVTWLVRRAIRRRRRDQVRYPA
jgi:hypothetical protein